MSYFKHLLPGIGLAWMFLFVPGLMAQTPKSEPVYLEEPAEEPPPSVVTHRKAQGKYEDGQFRMEREEALLSDDTVVSDGTYIEYYPDGQKFCEGKYENGVISGTWDYWHPNGQLSKSVEFKNGKPDGKIEIYRADGTLEAVQSYKNGVRHGEWISYYEDGKTPKAKAAIVDGNFDGERTTYYSDGTIRQQTNFVAGLLDGVATEYDETGKKIGEATFEKGQRKSTERFDQDSK
ncbi:toxin-antitoxin system YwqK family antitoxin [Bythopirellula polymerisocia]|uniref:MORN repeat variant n=1 Tax=Bythopirellula polymerisocia TaxID=2528003 RepID=A0A5C6CVG2_9BACT|nr:toxin-antitoxin system YwqK family antitoxin [Bythopirellula polymerisocia]TWU28542.1 MORN repeat variant [Bythopirellula polymerisocia]